MRGTNSMVSVMLFLVAVGMSGTALANHDDHTGHALARQQARMGQRRGFRLGVRHDHITHERAARAKQAEIERALHYASPAFLRDHGEAQRQIRRQAAAHFASAAGGFDFERALHYVAAVHMSDHGAAQNQIRRQAAAHAMGQ